MPANMPAREPAPAPSEGEWEPPLRHEWEALLAVATLYSEAFSDDERMTLIEIMRLQEVDDILQKYGKRY